MCDTDLCCYNLITMLLRAIDNNINTAGYVLLKESSYLTNPTQ